MATRVFSLDSSRRMGMITAAGALALCAGAAHADFAYQDFSSTEGVFLVGAAKQAESSIHMTDIGDGRTAAALWRMDKQDVAGGFTTTFSYTVPEMLGQGADGVAFVIQNTSIAALGGNGGGMGYANNPLYGGTGIRNSLAVEFDMWDNKINGDWDDLDDNHVSVQTAGAEPNSADQAYSLGAASVVDSGTEGVLHTARIAYQRGVMTVWVDDLSTPVLTLGGIDLEEILKLDNGTAWVGITAAAGGETDLQTQVLHSWSFTTTTVPAPAGAAVFGLGGLALLRRRRR